MSAEIIELHRPARLDDEDGWVCGHCGSLRMYLGWSGRVFCWDCRKEQGSIAWVASAQDRDEIARAMLDHNLDFVDAVYFVSDRQKR